MDKKDPGKFTVRFNAADPQQRVVIDILNQQGRYKAQFLSNAVLHYIHCPETPDIYTAPTVDNSDIVSIVKNILAEQQTGTQTEDILSAAPIPEKSPKQPGFEQDGPLGDDDRTVVLKTLQAFRTP